MTSWYNEHVIEYSKVRATSVIRINQSLLGVRRQPSSAIRDEIPLRSANDAKAQNV